jgi:hypothetical protein
MSQVQPAAQIHASTRAPGGARSLEESSAHHDYADGAAALAILGHGLADSSPPMQRAANILALQRLAGNHAVVGWLAQQGIGGGPARIQRKSLAALMSAVRSVVPKVPVNVPRTAEGTYRVVVAIDKDWHLTVFATPKRGKGKVKDVLHEDRLEYSEFHVTNVATDRRYYYSDEGVPRASSVTGGRGAALQDKTWANANRAAATIAGISYDTLAANLKQELAAEAAAEADQRREEEEWQLRLLQERERHAREQAAPQGSPVAEQSRLSPAPAQEGLPTQTPAPAHEGLPTPTLAAAALSVVNPVDATAPVASPDVAQPEKRQFTFSMALPAAKKKAKLFKKPGED